MKLLILSPESTLFDGDISLVQLPGIDGLFEVLPRHAQMITTLAAGDIRIVEQNGKETVLRVQGGVFEVTGGNKATVLAM
ncbi:MAG: F0F1 ATP synthase subunit epsilon [Bacteroidales bacterium]|jgi:F-type H+-transporting ATPase subunit epsilon|nr:F0F1 ATP synthase subunit epsilon [Bacteroidales bacterium]